MKTDTIKLPAEAAEGTLFLGDDWFDPLEAGVRTRIRGFIEELLEAELDAALGPDRYERPRVAESGWPVVRTGHRHGHRERQLMGTFGPVTVHVPRARLETSDGKTGEWKANDDGKLIMPPKILTAFKAAGEPITSAAALATALAAFEAAAMLITPQSVSA